MISRYAAVLQHLKTGRITAELPIESAKASTILNSPGSVDVVIPLGAGPTLTEELIAERANAVFLLRDDTIVGEGIIETTNADVAANGLTIECLGWLNYLRHIHLYHSQDYVGIDQTLIAKALVDYASTKPGALSFATTGVTATGRVRDRSYYWFDRPDIGTLIEQLAAVIDGFHFRFRSTRAAEGFTTEFLTSYPASGRVTNFVLELGGNVELLGQTGDGSGLANSVDMIGAGQGADAPIENAIDTNLLDSMPLWEAVETHADVTERPTLQEKAQRRLAQGRRPVKIPKLRIGADVEPRIGSYLCGDRVRVRGRHGLMSVDADFVITQIDLTVGRTGEFVDLSVAPVEQFLA